MISRAYAHLEELPITGPAFIRLREPLRWLKSPYNRWMSARAIRESWRRRVDDVVGCPDERYIPRVAGAGRIHDGHLVMHNGLRVLRDSYCGPRMTRLMQRSRGLHEPQEERVLMEVLRHLPADAVMIELGAYWGFYSMWFHAEVESPTCILVEPEEENLASGRANFAANGMKGEFVRAWIGSSSGTAPEGVPIVCVDDLIGDREIERVHVLHADIQGGEVEMLRGARRALEERRVDYVFISTHSDEQHTLCRQMLQESDFVVLADADLRETYSYDGLLVARRRELAGAGPVEISHKPLRAVAR